MTTALSVSSDANWLQQYLLESINKGLCTNMCTTCGALEFRRGLMVALANASGLPVTVEIDLDLAQTIAQALARVSPTMDRSSEMEGAARLILFEIWRMIDAATAERDIEPILAGTWAAGVLARMKAHHKVSEEARRAVVENQDPVRVQQRRDEKKRLRKEKHTERLAQKKERDHIWREKQRSSD